MTSERHAAQDTEVLAGLIADLVGLRRHLGITQAELARRMGNTQSTVSALERGGSGARFSTVQAYACALGARLRAEIEPPTTHTTSETAPGGPMSDEYHLYRVQYVADRELTATEIRGLRALDGSLTVTNVTVHPFPGEDADHRAEDEPAYAEFATPRGYLCAVVPGVSSVAAAARLADVAFPMLGEGHLVEVKIHMLCRFDMPA